MSTPKSTPGAAKVSKGSKTSEIIIGQGAARMKSSVAALVDVVEKIKDLNGSFLEDLQLKIADSEAKYEEQELKLKELVREGKVNVDLAIKEYGFEKAVEMCKAAGFVVVKSSDYTDLNNSYSKLKSDFEKDVASRVAIARNEVIKDCDNKVALMTAEHNSKIAQVQASLDASKSTIENLEKQLEDWKKALDSERNAGIERAKAGAVGKIEVNSSQK